MIHTMKLWERFVEYRLGTNMNVTKNQFGFMHEIGLQRHLTSFAIFGHRSLVTFHIFLIIFERMV
jgi:hypothetical protein